MEIKSMREERGWRRKERGKKIEDEPEVTLSE